MILRIQRTSNCLSIASAALPPRDPNDDDDDEEEEDDDGEADEEREPAVIREPDEDA